MEIIDRLASAALNNIIGGLNGVVATENISLNQLKDELVETRQQVIAKYAAQNQLPLNDLYLSINCLDLDCKSLSKCCLAEDDFGKPIAHFEVPQIATTIGDRAIQYIGAIDKSLKFSVYTNPAVLKFHKYKKQRKKRPFVFIDVTPNNHNLLDGWVFDAPLLEKISISAIFKDIRDLEDFTCCSDELNDPNNITWIDVEAKDTLIQKYIKYYRQLYPQPQPNNQVPS